VDECKPLSGGDLASLLNRQKKRRKRLPEEVVVDWFAQVILGAGAYTRPLFSST